ncbi:hypothetical protein BN2475_270075 [Paraburkholderia ribeironis]|uniref:Uncharacterized protein n=1 Tax=Paraburkholderia ribeironis TaxID=1247936 RepID=A0A1N7S082_9BURK|nr:hypothetical protein [Paraburkholderia ribeironis]SIT40734.1 hypothetical protein BN2475_270075 [Paraburkholderia ribeironis]
MVTKVPELLHRRRWLATVPDRPQVIGYVSILLNATGLRKLRGIGYTLAGHAACIGLNRGQVRRLWGRSPLIVFEYFIGLSIQVCQGLWQASCDAMRISLDNDAAFCGLARRDAACVVFSGDVPHLATLEHVHARSCVQGTRRYGSRNVPSTIVTDGPPIHVLPRASS